MRRDVSVMILPIEDVINSDIVLSSGLIMIYQAHTLQECQGG